MIKTSQGGRKHISYRLLSSGKMTLKKVQIQFHETSSGKHWTRHPHLEKLFLGYILCVDSELPKPVLSCTTLIKAIASPSVVVATIQVTTPARTTTPKTAPCSVNWVTASASPPSSWSKKSNASDHRLSKLGYQKHSAK